MFFYFNEKSHLCVCALEASTFYVPYVEFLYWATINSGLFVRTFHLQYVKRGSTIKLYIVKIKYCSEEIKSKTFFCVEMDFNNYLNDCSIIKMTAD